MDRRRSPPESLISSSITCNHTRVQSIALVHKDMDRVTIWRKPTKSRYVHRRHAGLAQLQLSSEDDLLCC